MKVVAVFAAHGVVVQLQVMRGSRRWKRGVQRRTAASAAQQRAA